MEAYKQNEELHFFCTLISALEELTAMSTAADNL